MFWKSWIKDIREKTSGMDRREVCGYIAAYYMPHILGSIFIIGMILLFGGHYLFGNKKPSFTCVFINQRVDSDRDMRMAETFAEEAGLEKEEVVIDSDYNFSYGEIRLEGVNESSYEKFFFQWQNGELDAVIMPESFYKYCKELGGEFRVIENPENFERYEDDGVCTGIILGKDSFTEKLTGDPEEPLLLIFPETGKHKEAADRFPEYLLHVKSGTIEGMRYEEFFY